MQRIVPRLFAMMVGVLLWGGCTGAPDRSGTQTLPAPPREASTPSQPDGSDRCPPIDGRWVGEMRGNGDVHVEVEFRTGDPSSCTVEGRAEWNSTIGTVVRYMKGRYRPRLHEYWLHDVKLEASRPAPGWRFCIVDRYRLRLYDLSTITGEYYSADCEDRATVFLIRE